MKYKELLKKQIKDLSSENRKPFAGLMEDLRHEYTVKGPTAIEMMQLLQDIVAGAEADTIDGLKTRLVRLDKMREYLLKSDLKGEEQKVVYKAYVKVQSAIRMRKDSDKKRFDTLSRMVNEAGSGLLNAAEQVSEEFPLFKAGLMASKFFFKHAKQASDLRKQKLRERNDSLRKDSELFYKREILRNKGQTGKLKPSRRKRSDDFYPNTFSGEKLGGPQTIHEMQQAYGVSGFTNLAKSGMRGPSGLRESQETKMLRVISTDVKKIVKYLDWKKIQEKDASLDALEALREGSKGGLNRGSGAFKRDLTKTGSGGIAAWLADHVDEAAELAMLAQAARSGKTPGIPGGGSKAPGGLVDVHGNPISSKAPLSRFEKLRRFIPRSRWMAPVGLALGAAEYGYGAVSGAAKGAYNYVTGGASSAVDDVVTKSSGLLDEFGRPLASSGLVDDAGNVISKSTSKIAGKAIPFIGGGISAYFDYNDRRARGQNMLRSGAGALFNGVGTVGGQIIGGGIGALAGGWGAVPGEIAGGYAGGKATGKAFDNFIDGSMSTSDKVSERRAKGDYLGAAIEIQNAPFAKMGRMMNPLTGMFEFGPSPVSMLPDDVKRTVSKAIGKDPNDITTFDLLNFYRDSKNAPKKEDTNRVQMPPYLTSPSPERELSKFLADQGVIPNGPELTPMERALKKAREEKKKTPQTAADKLPENQLSKAVDTALQVEQKNDPGKMPSALLPLAKITGARGLKDLLKTGSNPLGLLFPIDPSTGVVEKGGLLDAASKFIGNLFGGGSSSSGGFGGGGSYSGATGASGGVPGGSPAGAQGPGSSGGQVGGTTGLTASPGQEMLGTQVNSSGLASAADALKGMDTSSGPGGGRVSCVYAVNKVFAKAGMKPPWGNAVSVKAAVAAMNKEGWQQVPAGQQKPGDIWIAPSPGSHVGIVTPRGTILSNSSSNSSFTWEGPVEKVAGSYSRSSLGSFYRPPAGQNASGESDGSSGATSSGAPSAVPSSGAPGAPGASGASGSASGSGTSPMAPAALTPAAGTPGAKSSSTPTQSFTGGTKETRTTEDGFTIESESRTIHNQRDLTPDERKALEEELEYQRLNSGGASKTTATSEGLSPDLSSSEKEFVFGKEDSGVPPLRQQPSSPSVPIPSAASGLTGNKTSGNGWSLSEMEAENQKAMEQLARGENPDTSKLENMLERYDTEKTKRTPTLDQVKKASAEEWKNSDARTRAALEKVANGGEKSGVASQDFLNRGPNKKDGSMADYDPNNYKGVLDKDPYNLQQAKRAKELGYDVVQDPDSGEWVVNDPSGEFDNIYKAEQNLKPDKSSPNMSGARQDIANSGAQKPAAPVIITPPAQQPANQSSNKSNQESTKEESAWCDTRTASCRDAIKL